MADARVPAVKRAGAGSRALRRFRTRLERLLVHAERDPAGIDTKTALEVTELIDDVTATLLALYQQSREQPAPGNEQLVTIRALEQVRDVLRRWRPGRLRATLNKARDRLEGTGR